MKTHRIELTDKIFGGKVNFQLRGNVLLVQVTSPRHPTTGKQNSCVASLSIKDARILRADINTAVQVMEVRYGNPSN